MSLVPTNPVSATPAAALRQRSFGFVLGGATPAVADLDTIRNVCRCGTYSRIREAVKTGAARM